MDFDEIEVMKKAKQNASGNTLYRYPGELVESDEDYHGGDNEHESIIDIDALSASELSSSEHSDCSFGSHTLIDGYKDFVLSC